MSSKRNQVKLPKAQLAAIEYIGRHRKTDARVGKGKPISQRTFNALEKKHLVMYASERRKTAMLTYLGERVWTKLHPTSKYRIS